MCLQLLVPVLVLLAIEPSLVCIYRGVCLDSILSILVVNLLEGVLVEVDGSLAVWRILIDQLGLVLHLCALG